LSAGHAAVQQVLKMKHSNPGASVSGKSLPLPETADAGRPVTLALRIGHTPVAFRCFDTPLSRDVTSLVLRGISYPFVDLAADARCILDIGANIGAAAFYFAHIYPRATIHAFEPAAKPFELLCANTAALGRVHAHRFGLFDRDLSVTLHTSAEDSVLSTIGTCDGATGVGETIQLRSAGAWLQEAGIASIDILKLDTEGCELAVLASLGPLVRDIKVIHVEYHSEHDRRTIDALLAPTHILARGSVFHLHRGELTYVQLAAFGDSPELWKDEIRLDMA